MTSFLSAIEVGVRITIFLKPNRTRCMFTDGSKELTRESIIVINYLLSGMAIRTLKVSPLLCSFCLTAANNYGSSDKRELLWINGDCHLVIRKEGKEKLSNMFQNDILLVELKVCSLLNSSQWISVILATRSIGGFFCLMHNKDWLWERAISIIGSQANRKSRSPVVVIPA